MEGAPVFYVHGDLGDDGTGDGSAGSPFATIGHALGLVPFQGQGVVRVAAASAPYLESVDIEFRTVALLGDGMPVINPGLGFGVGVNSARAFVSGFRIHSSDYPKARCLDGVFFLENAVMHNGSSDGVYIGADCAAALRNVMVSGHSGTTLDRREIRADGPTSVHYSTIVGGATDLPGIECGALGTIDFRNTLFIEESGQLTTNCPGATFEHSGVLTTAGVDRPSGVVDLGPFEFEYFDIVYPGEYKVSGDGQGTPFGGLAELGPGDPYFDYEHDPRPSDGFIGADQPY